MQESIPKHVMDAVERCREVFVRRSAAGIEKEIQSFYLHHDDHLTWLAKKKTWEETGLQVERDRKAHIAGEMAEYDRDIRIQAEQREWEWSPLFMDLICAPLPPFLHRPYEHDEDEFQALLKWLEREGKCIGDRNPPPHMARALKLFSRSENGARMPMLCPVGGLTPETLLNRGNQVMFAMEELIRVGKIYFPTLDVEGEDFKILRTVLDCAEDQGGQVESFTAWRRSTFIRACCDTLSLEKEACLRDMWVNREGVDKDGTVASFRNTLLLRENIDLGYVFGSLEATGVWPRGGDELFDAAKVLRRESISACHAKLSKWSVTQDLGDLDDFRASQVLCTFDRSRFSGETESSPSRFSAPGGSATGGGCCGDEQQGGGGCGQVEDGELESAPKSPVVSLNPT